MGPGSASRESSAPPVIPGISFRSITVLPFSTPVIVLDLDFVSAAEIDAAVASLRHHDLDVELEVLEFRFGHEVRSRILVHERPVFRFPAVRLRSVPRHPAREVDTVEERDGVAPRDLGARRKLRSAHRDPLEPRAVLSFARSPPRRTVQVRVVVRLFDGHHEMRSRCLYPLQIHNPPLTPPAT